MVRFLACSSLCLSSLSAQFEPAPFLLGGEHQLSSDLEDGGSFSRTSSRIRVNAPLYLGTDTFVGISAGYEFEQFNFDDVATEPWSDLNRINLGLIAKSDFADSWSWLALPWLSSSSEQGADFGDSLSVGAIGGIWHQYNESLSLGLGAGVASRIEDNVVAFPILLIDWQMTDTLTLTTAPPRGFRFGPGATLRWDPREDVSVSFVYQYQSQRQRLDEDSPAAAGGVGEFRQNRVAIATTFQATERFLVTAHAGLAFGGEIELQDAGGQTLNEQEFDSTLVFGLEASYQF